MEHFGASNSQSRKQMCMGEALRTFSDKLMLKVILQLKIHCTNYVNAKKIGMFDLHDAERCV